ncbi:MAG: histidinol dehydrogenase [Chitinophagales bacterium]
MKHFANPDQKDWPAILHRPVMEAASLEPAVANILKEVKEGGDDAVKRFSAMFDKSSIDQLEAGYQEIENASSMVSEELKHAIQQAAKNISSFHKKQISISGPMETMPGIHCWRKSVAIEKVGLYIPGGTAPLFSTVLMLAIPASLAGCREIILCSPPSTEGKLHPAILHAAKIAGVTRVFKVGGVQAIAAMAYGTSSIPQVYKIFGPGNQYVTCAKRLVQKDGVAIDLPAGPSELAIYANESGNPAYIAADLLSQAEHGIDSQVLLICESQRMIEEVEAEIQQQLQLIPRKQIAKTVMERSVAIQLSNEDRAMELLNFYAPEHLMLSCDHAEDLASKVVNAGSVFLGHFAPESAGDYASGTNHVLPTNGHARALAGVSVESFVKKISFQKLSRKGLSRIGETVKIMAEAEGLHAHAQAVEIRLKGYAAIPESRGNKK